MGNTDADLRRQRQLIAKARKQLGHARHYVNGQKRYHAERRKKQEHRIRQRPTNLAPQSNVAPHVSNIATQDFIERARTLACENGCRIDSGKDSSLISESLRQSRAAAYLIFDIAEHGT